MNRIALRQIERNLLAAGLALAGTLASFAATTTPVHAQTPVQRGYSATLVTPLGAPSEKVINDVVWNCAGDSCTAPIDGSPAARTCARVVKSFGKLAHFATPKGEFSADELQHCNGG